MNLQLQDLEAPELEWAQQKSSVDCVVGDIIRQCLERYLSVPCAVRARTYVSVVSNATVSFKEDRIAIVADSDCARSLLQVISGEVEQRQDTSPSDLEVRLVVQALRVIHKHLALMLTSPEWEAQLNSLAAPKLQSTFACDFGRLGGLMSVRIEVPGAQLAMARSISRVPRDVLMSIPFDLRLCTAQFAVPLRNLRQLQSGDCLNSRLPLSSDLRLCAGDVPLATSEVVTQAGRRCARISKTFPEVNGTCQLTA